jgi:hypothetical protein
MRLSNKQAIMLAKIDSVQIRSFFRMCSFRVSVKVENLKKWNCDSFLKSSTRKNLLFVFKHFSFNNKEQRLVMDCMQILDDKQLGTLKVLFNQLRDIKAIDKQLIAQIKKEKFMIEKVCVCVLKYFN